jgi:dynein light chain LC8-type
MSDLGERHHNDVLPPLARDARAPPQGVITPPFLDHPPLPPPRSPSPSPSPSPSLSPPPPSIPQHQQRAPSHASAAPPVALEPRPVRKEASPPPPPPKVVVKSADMSEDMQRVAITIALTALGKFELERDMARFLKDQFDARYQPSWHCVVGRSFGSFVTHEHGGFVYFYIDRFAFMLYKH